MGQRKFAELFSFEYGSELAIYKFGLIIYSLISTSHFTRLNT